MGAIPEKIGPYEVQREVGRGGMGVVYLARDAALDRQVAIKTLPRRLATHTLGLGRFRREAKLLASLHHTNIAGVYGFELSDGEAYLVLEYVEGRGLDQVLRNGPLPVPEALGVARQIAEAIEAAHDRGIIHRDLKPANIRITPEGRVKVLDFGLAKALGDDSDAPDVEDSFTAVATVPGVVLGTAGYMSPEQARGKPVDKRTDIWSFGCILYECFVGRKVFTTETVSDSIADILHEEPDWEPLPADTPPTIQLLLRRCLAKDRDQRLHDIADARVEIQDALNDPRSSALSFAGLVSPRRPRRRWPWLALGAAAGIAVGAVVGGAVLRSMRPEPAASGSTVRFTLDLPAGETLGTNDRLMNELAITPDGRTIVFLVERDGQTRLMLRDLDDLEARPIPDTGDARGPFFSPDGRWLGYVRGFDTLMKVSLQGGPHQTICDAPEPNGTAAWLPGDVIVFTARDGNGLMRVDADGGEPRALAEIDPEAGILGFENVSPDPAGRGVLAGVRTGTTIEDYRIVHVDLEHGTMTPLLTNAAHPAPMGTSHLVFLRDSSLLAVPFDFQHLRATGPEAPVLGGVSADNRGGSAQYAISPGGTMVFVPGQRRARGRGMVAVDPSGRTTPIIDGTDAFYDDIRLSPKGRRVAVLTLRRGSELWCYDRDRRTLSLLNGEGDSVGPVWSPDGSMVAFRRTLGDLDQVLMVPADGGRAPTPLPLGAGAHVPTSWASDGASLLLTREHNEPDDNDDIVIHRTDGEGGVEPFLVTDDNESEAYFSPDGKWIAYRSDKTGRPEVYVRTYPDRGRAWQISIDGGYSPAWSVDGRLIYFVNGNTLLAAPVELEPEFRAGEPTPMFDSPTFAEINDAYCVDPDGGFVMIELAEWERSPAQVQVAVNWGMRLGGD